MLTAGATLRKFGVRPWYRPVGPSFLRIVRKRPDIVAWEPSINTEQHSTWIFIMVTDEIFIMNIHYGYWLPKNCQSILHSIWILITVIVSWEPSISNAQHSKWIFITITAAGNQHSAWIFNHHGYCLPRIYQSKPHSIWIFIMLHQRASHKWLSRLD